LSDNRKAYDNKAKKQRVFQKAYIKKRVADLIDGGQNTNTIAMDWNIPLATLNKIYTA
jgi:hypothetical protein